MDLHFVMVGVTYLTFCKKYIQKVYSITSFRKRFNNINSIVKRYGMAQRGIAGEHLYVHFHDKVHRGIEDMQAMIMNKTTLNEPI